MRKIGVIGDKDSVLAFRAFGLDVYPVSESETERNRRIVDRLARESYGIVFITEEVAQAIPETIDRYNKEILPAIILIPSSKGKTGVGLQRIRDNVEKAVGINILGEGR